METIYDQQMRVVTPFCRDLRDQVLRKFIIVILDVIHSVKTAKANRLMKRSSPVKPFSLSA